MREVRRTSFLLLALVLAASPRGSHAAPRTPVLVELFTSEGCSDCPPADTLLDTLIATQPIAGVEIIGLGQHVDYWDRLGWKDRFSSAALTRRQQVYQARFSTASMYTPQMVVDGRAELVGSDTAAARRAIERAMTAPHGVVRLTIDGAGGDVARPLQPSTCSGCPEPVEGQGRDRGAAAPELGESTVERRREGPALHITVSASDLPRLGRGDRADLIVAVTESGLRTDVKHGENHGRTLTHAPVVRHMATIGQVASDGAASASARADIPLAADWQLDHLTVVAFVQALRGRTILGSASVPLKNARP